MLRCVTECHGDLTLRGLITDLSLIRVQVEPLVSFATAKGRSSEHRAVALAKADGAYVHAKNMCKSLHELTYITDFTN